MTWAGRGLGDVRGLCVAMCVGFGAAPAQPREQASGGGGGGHRVIKRRMNVILEDNWAIFL